MTNDHSMFFGAIGDLHGDFDALDRIMGRHSEVTIWLCPGDLASDGGEYPRPRAPLYWIKGNNEDFDFVAAQPAGTGTIPRLHYIPNGASVTAGGVHVAGLGGTFAPTWYDRSSDELAAAAAKRDDKRRHFLHAEVEACRKLRGIDVFLSHEAARPFPLETARASGVARRIDAGKTPINEILTAMRPRLHLFGHHHKYSVGERQGVLSIGLDMASESYLIIDGKTLAHEHMKT